jgi:hypothetical protein
MLRCLVTALTAWTLLTTGTAAASELEDRLHARFRGSWGVLRVEVYSDCAGTYNNNTVLAAGVTGKASRRFEAGELVKIDKIKTRKARVDVLATFAESILVHHTDGPFDLYDEAECKVQLLIEVPRDIIKARDDGRIAEIIAGFVEVHRSLDAARASDAWNGRERDPFPEDYDLTLTRYEIWKAEQTNAAVASRREQAIEDAVDVADDIDDDPDYLNGFAAGVEVMKRWRTDDCGTLVDGRLSQYDDDPPDDKDEPRWREGFRDGQELIFNLLLVERLERCWVTVSPSP